MRFYKVQLDTIHLSSDGTLSGDPCKLSVQGADALLSNFTGSVVTSVDGTPVMQVFESGIKGKVLEISVDTLMQPVWASVITLINTAFLNSDTINIIGTGDIGNFDVDVIPLLPRPFEAQEFLHGRIKNAVFRFIST